MYETIHMFGEKLPKYIRYKIANMLKFVDLKRIALLNKNTWKMMKDDKFWRMRIYDKIGKIPKIVEKGAAFEWYVNNVKNIYGYRDLDTCSPLDPTILHIGENLSQVLPIMNHLTRPVSIENYVVNSVGQLYCLPNDKTIAENVKNVGAVGEKEVLYIDYENNLILQNEKKNVISKNVFNAKLVNISESRWSAKPHFYYVSENSLCVMKEMGGVVENLCRNVKKFIHAWLDDNLGYIWLAIYKDDVLALSNGTMFKEISKNVKNAFAGNDGHISYIDFRNNWYNLGILNRSWIDINFGHIKPEKQNVKDYIHDNFMGKLYFILLKTNGDLYFSGFNRYGFEDENGNVPEKFENFALVLKNVNDVPEKEGMRQLLYCCTV